MGKDLMCPFGTRCEIYQAHVDVFGYSNDTKKIIRGDGNEYYCRALSNSFSFNEDSKENTSGKECALIEILNKTNTL
jgi:hypothetical protein